MLPDKLPAAVLLHVPAILVVDETCSPPLTTYYIKGDNEISLDEVYQDIINLLDRPDQGRLYKRRRNGEDNLPELCIQFCSPRFQTLFWRPAAKILDYLADFLPHDTHESRALWFHFLDLLCGLAARLPHRHWDNRMPSCPHAVDFAHNWARYMDTVNAVVVARTHVEWVAGEVVHGREGLMTSPDFTTGGTWRAGVTQWAQYFRMGSPGFGVPREDWMWWSEKGGEWEGVKGEEGEVKYDQGSRGEEIRVIGERVLPMGAVSVVQKLLERGREMSMRLAVERGKEEWEGRWEYDGWAPSLTHPQPHPLLSTRSTTLHTQPFYPSPASPACPLRLDGLFDPQLLMPPTNLWMVDEAVGNYLGLQAVAHPLGFEWFQMMRVVSLAGLGRGYEGECEEGRVESETLEREMEGLMGDLWDEWVVKG